MVSPIFFLRKTGAGLIFHDFGILLGKIHFQLKIVPNFLITASLLQVSKNAADVCHPLCVGRCYTSVRYLSLACSCRVCTGSALLHFSVELFEMNGMRVEIIQNYFARILNYF